ncbi:MAG: aminotransferase class V-fold PLP-dependent enzyme [Firmicutes bacterium]|nr:aminotransferase class V-fold PLP-dependent enzyme [Bacillota bacterium]
MKTDTQKLSFASDYLEGAHPAILERLQETNFLKTQGYGLDPFSESARQKIRAACKCPKAEIHFLTGGTQANATVIDALLNNYQGVLSSNQGHISVHEAGAIELGGHKVLALPNKEGKIDPAVLRQWLVDFENDANHDHMVFPGMVYISHPTEFGTLYTLRELEEISSICKSYNLPLYMDGARLAYGLACAGNDVMLPDIARLCDVFYIGGTKCGALFGEAVVITRSNLIPHFFTIVKQHGALLAKGRITGLQFDTLFTNDLYFRIGKTAIDASERIRTWLKENGYRFRYDSPTNQLFVIMDNDKLEKLGESVEYSFWEKYDDAHTVIRFATSWATADEDVDVLISTLHSI